MGGEVLRDSPLEFMQEAVSSGECVAQSVIPNEDGSYTVACSCENFQAQAPDRWTGLAVARRHTGSPEQPSRRHTQEASVCPDSRSPTYGTL